MGIDNRNFYPRSPYGERLDVSAVVMALPNISIHALHTESDDIRRRKRQKPIISIHALHTESDAISLNYADAIKNFYPRSPYGERRLYHFSDRVIVYFYPRSPYGERLSDIHGILAIPSISIHALHTESDLKQPKQYNLFKISIHALHTESDSKRLQKICNLLFGMP